MYAACVKLRAFFSTLEPKVSISWHNN